MRALILAAGMGTRLLENTKEIPKCLVKVNEKPLLEYQLEALKANGIKDIFVVIGYKAERVREFIASNEKFRELNIRFIENRDYAESNSSYSFWLAKDEIKDASYLHFNCDVIFFADLIKGVLESKYSDVIVIDKKIELKDKMEQVILKGDKIVKMSDMHYPAAMGKAAGVAKFSPQNVQWLIERIGRHIDQGDKNQNYYGVIREAVDYIDFYGFEAHDNFLLEVNTLDELEKARKLVREYEQESKI